MVKKKRSKTRSSGSATAEESNRFTKLIAEFKKTQQIKSDARSGGGGGGGLFQNRWKPSELITKAIAFPGKYEITVSSEDGKSEKTINRYCGLTVEHWSTRANRMITCSAGLALVTGYGGRQDIGAGFGECALCKAIRQGDTSVDKRKTHLINLVLLGYWHETQEAGKNGGTYATWKKCKGERCKLCEKNLPRQFGRRVYWTPGSGHYEGFFDEADIRMGGTCSSCGGNLRPLGFVCPGCARIVVKYRDLDEEEVLAYKRAGVDCPKCNYSGPMAETFKCSGCDDPVPLPLKVWNNIIHIFKAGEKMKSTIGIKEFSIPSAKLMERIKEHMVPFTIAEVFPQRSIADQIERAKLSLSSGSDRSAHSSWDDEDE